MPEPFQTLKKLLQKLLARMQIIKTLKKETGQMETKQILVIHGPNLNTLGTREPDTYGSQSLADINKALEKAARAKNIGLQTFQSNHEGEIVDVIQKARGNFDALIINPAAYTHTSVAIRDAVIMLQVPVIEVHLSNIYKREPFRHNSMITDVATGQICGLGARGYMLALDAVISMIQT
jgi:3-dehydroquinate dehydratase-2